MKDESPILSYHHVLCQQGKKSMFWISILGVLGLSTITALNIRIDPLSATVYIPTMVLMLISLGLSLGFSYKELRFYPLLADLTAFSGIMGATALVMRAQAIQFNLTTSPLQYAHLVCFFICFRRRNIGIVRNTAFTLCSFICVLAYDFDLASRLYVHYAGGYFAGMLLYIIAEDRLYKNYLYRQSVDRERQESSRKYRHLHGELTGKCLPHQIDLILKGMSYKETMPIHREKFWSSKSLLVSPQNILVTQRENLFKLYTLKIQEVLRSQYDFKFIPLSRLSNEHDVFEVRGPGYLAKSGQDSHTITYGYPFPLANNENKGQLILSTIYKQLVIFKEHVCNDLERDNLTLVISLTFDHGRGIFSGDLSNYEIEGPTIELSEIYLNARHGIKDLNDMIASGHHAILIHSRVYQDLQRYIPGYLDKRVKTYKFTPHIRNDPKYDKIHVLYVHKDEAPSYYGELEDWFRQSQVRRA